MSDAFRRLAAELRPLVDAALDRHLPSEADAPERLHRAMRYSVFAGGKRFRPVLVVLAGEAYGADRSTLLPAAAALEMIHTFSLVHDDLPALDDDDMRRGRSTVHRRFDEATAVLVGDALLNLGLQLLMEAPIELPPASRLEAARTVAVAVGTGGMIGGQAADLEAERDWPSAPERALETIHQRKTGALITAALEVGGICAAVEPAERERLREIGARLGMLFQIGDDILDVEGESVTLGKTAGKDSAASKLTFPALHGLEESRAILHRLREEAIERVDGLPAGVGRFRSLVDYLCDRDR